MLRWLADRLGRVNPNLPSRGYQRQSGMYVAQVLTPQITCSQPHWRIVSVCLFLRLTNTLTYLLIPSTPDTGCDARQRHLPSPLQPGGKPSVVTSMNLRDETLVSASALVQVGLRDILVTRGARQDLWSQSDAVISRHRLDREFADYQAEAEVTVQDRHIVGHTVDI